MRETGHRKNKVFSSLKFNPMSSLDMLIARNTAKASFFKKIETWTMMKEIQVYHVERNGVRAYH